ncbi:hypothetical protein AA313_de0201513 [Arthrobotrys entomopaga]|nr:hypothetical protein AA313_de0201513 [Arthrobotrys entomopaga]
MSTDSYDRLLEHLHHSGYRFLCPTPETHEKYLNNLSHGQRTSATCLTDVFGWSLPIRSSELKPLFNDAINFTDVSIISNENGASSLKKPRIRVSTLNLKGSISPLRKDDEILYIHSAYPCTEETGGVFFGPDTYRFVKFLSSSSVGALIRDLRFKRTAIDLCCGAGAGALALSRLYQFERVIGLDVNSAAIDMAQVNAKTAQASHVIFRQSDFFSNLSNHASETVDVVICNPPYIPTSDSGSPVYCDGGDDGIAFSLTVIHQSLDVLQKDGLLVLYTGVCIKGTDPQRDVLLESCDKLVADGLVEILSYEVIDNDVFGDEVSIGKSGLSYIMVVGCVLRKL